MTDAPIDQWTTRLHRMIEDLGNNAPASPLANLYATRAGQVEIAAQLNRILNDIEADRYSRGTISEGLGRPNDVKRFVIQALRECERYSISPAPELIDLVERLFGSASDDNRRDEIKFPKLLIEAARLQAELGPLSSRKLASELRARGFDAKDRTIATYQKDQRFIDRVRALQKR
jgi:hypothetical protein